MTLDFLRFSDFLIIIASFHLPCMRNFEFIHIINYIIEKEIHMTDTQILIGLNIQQSKEKSIM